MGGFDEAVLRGKEIIRSGLSEIAELSDEAFIESRDYLSQGKRRIWHSETDAERYRTLREDIAAVSLALPAR